MIRLIVGFLLLWGTGFPALCASNGPLTHDDIKNISEITDAIYRLDFLRARAACERLQAQHPDDPLPDVFLARTIWQEEMTRTGALDLERLSAADFFVEDPKSRHNLEPNPAAAAAFEAASRQAEQKANALWSKNRSDLRSAFLLGMAYQYTSTFSATFKGGWKAAVFKGHAARKSHEVVRARYPDFLDAQLSIGVYDYAAGSVNWFYKLCGLFLGIRGSRERGLATLQLVAKESVFSSRDARAMLVLLYTREERYRDALALLQGLHKDYPENCLIPMDEATVQIYLKDYAGAIRTYRSYLRELKLIPKTRNCPSAARTLFRLGITHRKAGDLPAARKALEEAEAAQGEAQERLRVRLELAKILDLQGERAKAVEHYRSVKAEAVRGAERDQADAYLKRPYRSGS